MTKERISTRTTCPYCGTGCGVKIELTADGAASVAGDVDHPANFGRLCVKGAALGQTLGLEGRLLHPEIRGSRASWPQALDLVATRFAQAIERHGPDSVALYVSGQILTEDYYIANKMMKGFVGAANIDTNSRLCMAASVAGHKRAFGADTVPNVYDDLEAADLLVLVGSNLAWCHPVLYQRVAKAKAARPSMRVVNIDPRRTATSEIADMHLALAPGSDVALFGGLLRHLAKGGRIDRAFVAAHTNGLAPALQAVERWSPGAVARETGLAHDEVDDFYRLFAATDRTVTVYSQGVNQSFVGVDKVNAIVNCHLLTGRIGREGAGPFSVTGQPNAMGGREVGGLANQLACHMELENPVHRDIVRRFWNAPAVTDRPGLKAVDLFRAVGAGKIKALWIMGTNPVDSMPDADNVRAAIAACPFVVVSDVVRATDTTALAHVLLPAQAWGEKNGTVTNSERRVSRQRAFIASPGEAMPDWWALSGVARRLGFGAAFDHSGPADIFREYAAMSGFENAGARDFDISALGEISGKDYDALEPFQWPWRVGEARSERPKRFFADGRFFTPDGRGRFVPTAYRKPANAPDARHPFVMNTGRVRDQWHTMTRTGVAPRLSQHIAEPFVELHPQDAAELGVEAADLVVLENERGSIVLRALLTERQRRGSVFAPIHWTDQFASAARVDALIAPVVDAISGQPESKATPVAARVWPAAWFGFVVSSQRVSGVGLDYWSAAPIDAGWRMELAGATPPRDWDGLARTILDDRAGPFDLAASSDARAGDRRYVASRDGRTIGLFIAGPRPVEAARDWLCEQFRSADHVALLAARPGAGRRNPGRKICAACLNVGIEAIRDAILADGLRTIDAVSRTTQAGTGCGSCRPEIKSLIDEIGKSPAEAMVETMAAAAAAGG